MRREVAVLSSIAALLAAPVGSKAQEQQEQKPRLRFGADERVREEYFNQLPAAPGPTELDYFRFRTRVWGEADLLDDVTFRARIVNEFRWWLHPDMTGTPHWKDSEFPDEYVFDNLYFDVRDLFDKRLDLRAGRQDLMYGNGRVIMDGTPGDGSRTLYFNAVKGVVKASPNTTIDLLGIYDFAHDEIAINSSDRDLLPPPASRKIGMPIFGSDESGGGFYLKNKSCKSYPFETYGLFKHEEAWSVSFADAKNKKPYAWMRENDSRQTYDSPDLNLGTAGFRVMPQFTSWCKANVEAAYQYGQRGSEDVQGYMVDAYAMNALPFMTEQKLTLDYGVYYLSGDDPKTTNRDEGWDPLWSRTPQYSELYQALYPGTRWSNLNMPHGGFSLCPTSWLKTTAWAGHMEAPELDGPAKGHVRGWLYVFKNEFTLGQNLLAKNDKLSGHLWLEVLEPGSYYVSDDAAYFVRWQLMYEF